jgi:DNA-binding CsgD family transcriptional regulator
MALGRVGLARGDVAAVVDLERALDVFTRLELPWEAARARLAVAGARSTSEPEVALADARLAFAAFERLGASRDADAAARLLRELGAGTPPGPKGFGTLTRREAEVLDLVGSGLSNADISARLFISPRTVEHHVGRILAKLHLKTRPQVVAYAVRQAGGKSGQK